MWLDSVARPADEFGGSATRAWAPLLAGLVTAGLTSIIFCSVPKARLLSPGGVVESAALCVLISFLAAGTAAWILCSIVSLPAGVNARGLVLKTSCVAVWVVPLNLFLQQQSAFGMAMAAVLAASATLSLSDCQESSDEPRPESPGLLAEQVFVAFQARPLMRELLPALVVVACAEIAAVAQVTSHPLAAAALSGASTALLARSFAVKVWAHSGRTEAKSHSLLLLTLALVFTMVGLLPFLRRGDGGSGWTRKWSQHLFPQATASTGKDDTAGGDRQGEALSAGPSGGYSGIVLWPKYQEVVKLVAPPISAPSSLAFGARATAVSFPFNGVYWVFKLPDVRPPFRSHIAQGSPEEFNIHSTDNRPLRLEAHQNLATLIDLSCCRAIQVTIRDADRYPGSVALELILRNTILPGKPTESLGTIPVASTRPWTLYGETPTVSEVLNFNIPPQLALSEFDEIALVFQLSPSRSNFGPKIGIEKFTLIPRGLP